MISIVKKAKNHSWNEKKNCFKLVNKQIFRHCSKRFDIEMLEFLGNVEMKLNAKLDLTLQKVDSHKFALFFETGYPTHV